MRKIAESLREIKDPRILRYFNDCIELLEKEHILPPNSAKDIYLVANSALHVFGSIHVDDFGEKFILQLSSYLFEEPEAAIKNTILHELCHYIQIKEQIENGTVRFDKKGQAIMKRKDSSSGYESPHGGRWKSIAERVSKVSGTKITRTAGYDTHTEVGKAYADKIKYIIRCKNCGATFKFQKKTAFVQNVLMGQNRRN